MLFLRHVRLCFTAGFPADSLLRCSYLLVVDCIAHAPCGGSAHARLRGHSLSLQLGWVRSNHPLRHHHGGQGGTGCRPDHRVALEQTPRKETHMQYNGWPLGISSCLISVSNFNNRTLTICVITGHLYYRYTMFLLREWKLTDTVSK